MFRVDGLIVTNMVYVYRVDGLIVTNMVYV